MTLKSQKRKASFDTESPPGRLEASAKSSGLYMSPHNPTNRKTWKVKSEFRRSGRTKYIIGQIVNCRLCGKWEKATIQAFLPDGRISVKCLGSKETKEVTRAYLHDVHATPPSRMGTSKSVVADKRKPIAANNNVIDLTNSSSDESDEIYDDNEICKTWECVAKIGQNNIQQNFMKRSK